MSKYDNEERYEKPRYKEAILNKFVSDMLEAGLQPYHYRGRWYWEGPAANVDYIHEAMSRTEVPCQSDSMGLGAVVYPLASGKELDKEHFNEAEYGWEVPERDDEEEDDEEENEDE